MLSIEVFYYDIGNVRRWKYTIHIQNRLWSSESDYLYRWEAYQAAINFIGDKLQIVGV